MNKEMKGIITELIDHESGFITGIDGKKYFFTSLNFVTPSKLNINSKVIFKPHFSPQVGIYSATIISINN